MGYVLICFDCVSVHCFAMGYMLVCFDCVLVHCFAIGYVLQFGEVAHKEHTIITIKACWNFSSALEKQSVTE